VAIPLSEGLRRALAERLSAVSGMLAESPIAVERLHLTLHFLGPTLPDQLAPIEAALDEVSRRTRPFELAFQGVGAFPDERTPGMIWLGVRGDLPELGRLASDVAAALAPLGFPAGPHPFTPHVTLCRTKPPATGRRLLEELRPVLLETVGTMPVSAIALFRSETLPAGPRYTAIAGKPLLGGA